MKFLVSVAVFALITNGSVCFAQSPPSISPKGTAEHLAPSPTTTSVPAPARVKKPLELGLTKKLDKAPTAGPEAALDDSVLAEKKDDNLQTHCIGMYDRVYKHGDAGYAECMMEDRERMNYEREMRARGANPRPASGR